MNRIVALSLLFIATLQTACVTTHTGVDATSSNDPTLGSESSSTDYDSLVSAGDEAFARDDLDTAQLNYALAVNADATNISVLYKLGIVHYRQQSYEVAYRVLSQVIEQPEAPANAYETLGFIALLNEQYDNAETHFHEALTRQPARWRSLNGLGVLFDMQSMHGEAQVHFQRALLLSPTNEQVVNNLGYSLYLQGLDDEAQAHFLTATRLNPHYQKAWSNLGLSFVRQGRYNEARAAFSKVADTHVVSNNLGYLGLLQGDTDIAKQEFKAAIQSSPVFYKIANENMALVTQQENTSILAAGKSRRTNTIRQSTLQLSPLTAPSLDEQSIETPAKKPMHTMSLKTATLYLDFLGYQSSQSPTDTDSSLKKTIINFQANYGLEASGIIDSHTRSLIEAETKKRLDAFLVMQGYNTENAATSMLPSALRRFKEDHGLKVNDTLDKSTLSKIGKLSVDDNE